MLLIVAKGRLMTREFVDVEMLKMLPAVPVETVVIMLLMVRLEEARFLLASVTTKEEAVRVAMLTLPKLSMFTKLVPLEFWKEAIAAVWVEVALTTKVGVVEATKKDCANKTAVGDEVPIPTKPLLVITIFCVELVPFLKT